MTPSVYRSCVFGLVDDYDGKAMLQDVQKIKDGTTTQRETNPSTRMSARIPLRPIDLCKQFALAIDQVA